MFSPWKRIFPLLGSSRRLIHLSMVDLPPPDGPIMVITSPLLILKDENVFVGGRNKLFQWLRDNKFLMKDNEPYQKYIDNGVFEYVEYTYKTPYGEKLGHKTKISPKGQIYLVEKLRKIFK